MKRWLPLAFALAAVAVCFSPLSAQRPLFTTGTAAELAQARSIGLDQLRVVALQKGIDDANDLVVSNAHVDRLSMAHVRVQQRFHGIPVLGGEAIAHLNADGSRLAETDSLVAGINVSTTPNLTVDRAIDLAVGDYGCRACLTKAPIADLWILRDEAGVDHLTYRVQMVRMDGTNQTALPVRFIDAHGGYVVLAYDNLQTGTGQSLYSGIVNIGTYHNTTLGHYAMENLPLRVGTFEVRNGGGLVVPFTDDDDTWDSSTQRAGVDAHYGMERYFIYLAAVHGRNGIDGSGGPVTISGDGFKQLVSSIVHFGINYNNAFWEPNVKFMVYGDGDGSQFSPLVALDIAGHEMTHGVTQFTAGLVYQGESGALNESWSDVFGAMLERHVKGESANTWLLAEDAYTPSIAGDALRYLNDPHLASNKGYTADDDPDHYSERYTGTLDNGGVHINSGISNKAFYLLAKGGTHHLGGAITGIGVDVAAQIWFTALTSYMTSSTTFAGAREATTLAAGALYGWGSDEQKAVAHVWCLVGVGTCVALDTFGVSPNAGAGTTQTFALFYSDSAGAGDLSSARVRFATSSGQGAGSCSISYNATTAQIKLMDDAGVWGSPVALGSGTLSNSQCTLNLASTTAQQNGDLLVVSASVTFSASFTGLKNIYMLATSASGGISTSWIQRGTWVPSGVAAISVTPSSGSDFGQAFTLQYSDSQGASDLTSARVRFGATNDGPGSCTARYNATNGSVGLLNDAGTAWTDGTMGSGSLANSQCTLNLGSSSAQAVGTNLRVILDITFSPSFSGLKQIYMLAAGAGGANTGWLSRGTWTVPPPGPVAVAVSPDSGIGGSQTFTMLYSHTIDLANLRVLRVRFGAKNVGPGTCSVRYLMAGSVELLNDAGTEWTPGTMGHGTLSNSQCKLNLTGSSVQGAGPNVALVLNITFSPAFIGAKNIYLSASDAVSNSGWQQRGTWMVPTMFISADSASPNSGSGSTHAFTLSYSDSLGAIDLESARVRFGTSNVGPGTCTASYNAATNVISLLNDAGTASTTGTLGSGTLSNTQCTLHLTSSSASAGGSILSLVLNVTFAPGFTGQKSVYMLARSSMGPTSGWQQKGTWTVPPVSESTTLYLDSQNGDFIGQGQQYLYTPADATFVATRNVRNGVTVWLTGPAPGFFWRLNFAATGDAPLHVGSYGNATAGNAFNEMEVSGLGRGCELTGRFKVLEIVYDGNDVQRFAVDFEQHCDDADPALFGSLRYNSTIAPSAPFEGNYPSYKLHITPSAFGHVGSSTGIDCGDGEPLCDLILLSPADIDLTAVPNDGYLFGGWTGNCHGGQTIVVHVNTEEECSAVFSPINSGQPATLLFWNSQAGDYIGQGARDVYGAANSLWTPGAFNDGWVVIGINSVADAKASDWILVFQAPTGQPLLPGTYLNTVSFPTESTAGLNIFGNGRSCSPTGSFVVHAITMSDNTVTSLAVDFEQHCGEEVPNPGRPLIGSIRYNSTVPVTASLALTFTGHGSVTLSPSGTICTVDCTETAAVGTAYVVTVQPDPGWSFVSWAGDEDCVDGVLTLTAPTACRARFQQTGAALSGTPPIGP